MLMGIYVFVVVMVLFSLTIFVHELGHFLAAKACGMVIDAFSIGFGPAIWKKKIRGIIYKIGCIPFGGYVALPQLDPSSMSAVQGTVEKDGEGAETVGVKPRSLPPISPWKKIIVSLSGATGNMLLAVLLAWIIYFSPDVSRDEIGALVGHVATNSPAYAEGLRMGDTVVKVNGKNVNTWYDFGVECLLGAGKSNEVSLIVDSGGEVKDMVIPTSENEMGVQALAGVEKATLCLVTEVVAGGGAEAAGVLGKDIILEFEGRRVAGSEHFSELVRQAGERPVDLTVKRNGDLVHLSVVPRYSEEYGKLVVGVVVASAEHGGVPWMQYKEPYKQLKYDAVAIIRILKALVTPKESKQAAKGIGGPVMIVATLWVAIRISFLNAVGFLRFLNLNLAILNLLPIPVLDGGHIVFSLWEAMTRRKPNPRFVNVLVNVFAVLLIGVLILLTFRDSPRVLKMIRMLRGAEAVEEDEGNAERVMPNTEEGQGLLQDDVEGGDVSE